MSVGVERVPGGWVRFFEARSIAIGGMVVSLLGFWVVLPPITSRSWAWPVACGFLGVAAGIWAVTRGVKRVGWGAVALGIIVYSFVKFRGREDQEAVVEDAVGSGH